MEVGGERGEMVVGKESGEGEIDVVRERRAGERYERRGEGEMEVREGERGEERVERGRGCKRGRDGGKERMKM